MLDKKHTQIAAKQLNLPGDYELLYQAVNVAHITCPDDVTELLKYEDDGEDIIGLNTDNVCQAVNDATKSVMLPQGWRLVGMMPPNENDETKMVYGFVDFNSLIPNQENKRLIAEFMSNNFELFQKFISSKDIEETEAEVIINNIKGEL